MGRLRLARSDVSIRYLQIQLHISDDWKHVGNMDVFPPHNSNANEYMYKIIRQIRGKKGYFSELPTLFCWGLSAVLSEKVSQLVLVGGPEKDLKEKSEPRISVLIPARLIPKRGHGPALTALP